MNVVVDARMVGPIPHGISRYVSFLGKSLQIREPLPYQVRFLVNRDFSGNDFFSYPVIQSKSRFLDFRELAEIPKILSKEKADLYHSPSFSSLWNCNCPSIVTIHDLNHLYFGSVAKRIYYKTLLRRFALKSKKIITVSEFSRDGLADWLGMPKENIEIVSNVIVEPPEEKNDILKKYGLVSKKYFFCLSNAKPHKNLRRLMDAYSFFISQQREEWPLVMTTHELSGIRGIKFVGAVSENEVSILLKNAAGSFFPSRYEGFGLPPVEAAVAGSPLAVSRIPPHQEGLSELRPSEVHWISPDDLHGWASAFHKIYRSEIATPSIESREKILKKYNIEKMGERMDRIYRRVLGLTL